MEPEDLPWPSELEEEGGEEEKEEEEEVKGEKEARDEDPEEAAESLDEDEVVMVEDIEEEERPEPDPDSNFECQAEESSDDYEEDEEAKAWLQAHPRGAVPSPSPPKHRYSEEVVPLTSHVWQQSSQESSRTQTYKSNVDSLEERAQKGSGDDQGTESWHFLPQEIDSSHTSDTSQTRFNVREEGTDTADFLSEEEGLSTQSENQVKKHNRSLFCSPLLVIQDNFASPDLPLLTCLTQDEEFEPDSIFHQSELDFAPLRGIPGKSEDTEGFSRPAEVSEAFFQATSEVASDLVNSCSNVSQHTLTGSTDVEPQGSFLHPEQETKEETVLTYTVDELQTAKNSDSYGALCSYMSWKIKEITQEPETNLADKDQFSSTSSDTVDECVTPKESDSFDACSDVHHWKQEALQQSEKYLTSKDHDFCSDSSDTIDKNKSPEESDNFNAPFSFMPRTKQGASYHPETGLVKKAGSSNIIYPLEVSTSDSLFSQDLKQQTFEEVADSSNYILEGLQEKAESDICSLGDDIECCSLDENAVVCSESELQREICNQREVTGNCTELTGLENMFDDLEIYDVSLPWQSDLQLPSEEEPDISEHFSSVLPPFVTHDPDRKLEYHSSDLRMLRVSPEIVPKTQKHLPGDISKEDVSEITQSNLKTDITTTSGDSHIGSHLPLSSEDFSQLAVRSSVEKTIGIHTDNLNQRILANGHVTEDTLQALADQKAGISTVPFSSYSLREQPNIFYPQALSYSHPIEEALRDSVVIGSINQKSEKTTVPSSSCTVREKQLVFSQPLVPDSLLTEQALKCSFVPRPASQATAIPTVSSTLYSQGEKPHIFYQQTLSECDLTEQSQQAAAVSEFAGQKTGIPTGTSSSYSHAEKPYIFYQQTLPDSYLTEQAQQAAAFSGFAGQKTGIPTGTSPSYSHREKPHIFDQQTFPENHLTQQALKVSFAPGSTEQKTGIPIVSSTYSPREKPCIFYQQELSESHPTEQSQQAATVSGFAGQKTEIPTGTSSSYLYGEKPHILYQQTLPESHLTKQSQQAAADSGFAGQKTEIPTITSSSYLYGEKPHILYQQTLPESHLTEQSQAAAVSGFAGQKTEIPTGTSSSYLYGEKPHILYQQTLPESHLTEQSQAAAVSGFAGQKTEIPTGTSSSYLHAEKPHILYQQTLPESHLTKQSQQAAADSGFAGQKTEIPTGTSSSYLHGEKPHILYQQTLPESHLTEQSQQAAAVSGFAGQKTGTSTSYSHGEKPHIFYQQTLPESQLTEQALKVSAAPGLVDQKGVTPTLTSTSSSQRDKPNIIYQQELPVGHLTKEAEKFFAVPGLAQQKTGIPTAPPTSYSPKGNTSFFYQQKLPDSHLTEQAQRISSIPGQTDQNTGIQTVPSSAYSHREKPTIFYQQEFPEPPSSYSHSEKSILSYPQAFPGTHFTEEALKVSTVSGPADQNPGIQTLSSASYPPREKHIIISPQALPDSHLLEEALKVSTVTGPANQKTGLPSEPPTSYSNREKPIVFYPQSLTESNFFEETLKFSALSEPADQKTGLPLEPSSFSLPGEESSISYQQGLPDSHLTEKALKVSAIPGTGHHSPAIPTVSPSSYSLGGKSIIFYQQVLPDRHLTEEALNVSTSGPADQKTGLPVESSASYSHREKPFLFYPQALPDAQLTEETLKVSAVSLPGYQKTGIPSVTPASYSSKEKPIVFYQQALPDSPLTLEALKVSAVAEPDNQNTRKPTEVSASYSHKEKPIISYQQELFGSHLTEEALKVSGVPGLADQKTGIPTVSSISYSYEEKPIISSQRALTKVALKALGVSGPVEQKTGIPIVTSTSYSPGKKPIISYQQELPNRNEDASKLLAIPGSVDQKTGIRIVPSSYLYRENPIISYQEFPDITEKSLEVSAVPGPTDQKTGIRIIPSGSSYRQKGNIFYQQELPGITNEDVKVLVLSEPVDQKTEIPEGSSRSYPHKEKPGISTVILPDDQKTEFPTATLISYAQIEKPKSIDVVGAVGQPASLLTVFGNSHSQKVKPNIFFKQHLQNRQHSEGIQKISSVPESTDVNSRVPIPLPNSYSHRGKSNIVYPQELSDKHLTEDVLTVSTIPKPADQKTVLPSAAPHFFSHREKQNKFYEQDLSDRHLSKDALKFSSGLGHADQITGLSAVYPGTSSHSERHRLVSDHVQRPIDHLDSANSSIISNNMPLNSQADGRVVINKPEPSGFEDTDFEECQGTDNGSKALKEIQTLLMEAENIALKRCNFPAPLVPFRDVNDISFIQSKKVVCFKDPPITDEPNIDSPQRKPFIEENPNKYLQKNISTQTNPQCQGGIENWEFVSSTTVRNPLQEAEIKARMSLDETLRQYNAGRSVMRSEPEGCSGTFGNKILIPMMTIIKSDSSSDVSSCSWESNSFESVSDVLLNLFPYTSPKTSMTDSREEEFVSESDEGRGSSVDSLAAHVKTLLKCESSLNHAKQILRNAEEEESRVRARAWNLKFNMARECGYSISELNEDDRRKVEEIKAKLFGYERTHLSKGLRSPQGIRCQPEAVCSHIIIESHEKGCFRTLTPKQTHLDSHPYVYRSPEPLEIIRGHRNPSSWRTRHLSKSLDQNNTRLKVWNSLQLQSRSPVQNFTTNDFKINKGFRMPFHENMDPWMSDLVEPTYVLPEEMDCHSSHMLSPESMKKFTTSITYSSHRHSKCFSDSSVLKVGVTEDSQCTGASVGVFNSHFTEEQSPLRNLKHNTYSPSSFKISHSTPGVKEKNITVTPNSPPIFLEQPEFCKVPRADHYVRKPPPPPPPSPPPPPPPPPPQHYVAPNLPCHIFLENRELLEQSKTPQVDHQMRKSHSPFPQGQSYIAPDLPSTIFLEQRELFEQSRGPDTDHLMKKQYSSLPQGQDYVVENEDQQEPKSYVSNIKIESNSHVVSLSAPSQKTLVRSPSTLPSNKKVLSLVRITLSPKTSSKLDSGTLDKSLISLDPASKTRMNSEVNSNLQTVSSRSLESTSKLLTSKHRVYDQESLGSLRPKSSLDFQGRQSLPDRNITQNSQIVTSRQTQVNFSDLEEYSNPEWTPVSSDGSLEVVNTQRYASSRRLLSDAITQITTESPGKAMFSSQIFIKPDDGERAVLDPSSHSLSKAPSKFASSSSVQQIAVARDTTGAQPSLLSYKPSGSTSMYYAPQVNQSLPFVDSKSKTSFAPELRQSFSPVDSKSRTSFAPELSKSFSLVDSKSRTSVAPELSQSFSSVDSKSRTSFAPELSKSFSLVDSKSRTSVAKPVDSKSKTSFAQLSQSPSLKSKSFVPQLGQIPSSQASKSDTTIESSHSGSNDAIAPDFPAQVLGTRDDDLESPVNIKHKEGIYSKRASSLKGKKSIQKDNADSCDDVAAELAAQLQDTKIESLPKESLQIDIEECSSKFENTTHSVFRSAKFYFHHPVHLPSDRDICHDSLGRSVFMGHSWKDFFQHHPDKHRICFPPSCQNEEKTECTRIESLRINVNLGNKEMVHPTKSQAEDYTKSDKQINDQKKNRKGSPEPTTQHITSLNELWNKYQERQKQQKSLECRGGKELSLVERLDRLAKLLQNPVTHSPWTSDSTQDDSRGQRDTKEWNSRQQQRNRLQKKKRYKSLEKCHKNIDHLKKSSVLSTHQARKSNQIKIHQVKFDKYILRKQPNFCCINNTSSDSRPSEESELLTDTPTNILSTSTSPVESDILTQTDKEVTVLERSSSLSTIDTARLIQAFGHERVSLSPRRVKLYSSITDHQKRYIEKRSKNKKKALSYPQMTSEHTKRKHIQMVNRMISSDSISSSTGNFWSSNSTLCDKQNIHMLNKGVQTGDVEIVNGVKKNTRDVGVIFPIPSLSEVKVEEDSDVTSWSEEKVEEKKLLTRNLGDKKLRKNKQSCCEDVSWFVPVENVKSGPKKENLNHRGPGISWFAPITNTKPWREPLREQNWQSQHTASHMSLPGPSRSPLKPLVKATLQESLLFHRPDFISRSGERIKRLKLIVQERKLQNVLQNEREVLFNTGQEWQGQGDSVHRLPKKGFLAAQKYRPVGKKEMIQRSKRIYEQLPEVKKKREEERRRLEYKSYRLRAQLYKKKVTNQLLGRKVPWD